jgi:hypothetical protein
MPKHSIGTHCRVVAVKVPQVPHKQMTIDEVLVLAERDQILRIKLELGLQMKRPYVVHIHFFAVVSANDARRLLLEMRATHRGLFRRALVIVRFAMWIHVFLLRKKKRRDRFRAITPCFSFVADWLICRTRKKARQSRLGRSRIRRSQARADSRSRAP